ncbi:MAG: DHH family phosphoesterase [Chloroflexi bacterium]|nr:DHH family phosphoesterase [Chloroflexota bacterium]MBP8055872.1 DHH family phosphoesterase [Chloroflexota bacterium]
MKTSWETNNNGTTRYIHINAQEVVVGSHSGSGHTDNAGAVLHADFLQGQYHNLIQREFGPDVLAEVIEAVHAAATHPPFVAQREHQAKLHTFLDAIPIDPHLNALPRWPDTEHGYRHYGNAGGYKTIVHSDTLTLTTEKQQAILEHTATGEIIASLVLPGHISDVVPLADHFYLLVSDDMAVIAPDGSLAAAPGSGLFGAELRLGRVYRHGTTIAYNYHWLGAPYGRGLLRYQVGQGFTGRWPEDLPPVEQFKWFLAWVRGRKILHLTHQDADCDAIGSAFALSRVIPGDVGFARGLKTSAQDLADGLGLTYRLNPDPLTYDYVIIYDTPNLKQLALPLPPRFALFDHHVPGGHRYSNFRNDLQQDAEWVWVKPINSTCALLTELFTEAGIPITREMSLALAAGMVTDTSWLSIANAPMLRHLALALEPNNLYLEDVYALIDSPNRQAQRRAAVLQAFRHIEERQANGLTLLATVTDSYDNGFAVMGALARLGADVRLVAFPKIGTPETQKLSEFPPVPTSSPEFPGVPTSRSQIMFECDGVLVEQRGVDFEKVGRELAAALPNGETWGTRSWGRVVADMMPGELLAAAIEFLQQHL